MKVKIKIEYYVYYCNKLKTLNGFMECNKNSMRVKRSIMSKTFQSDIF